MLKMLDLWSRCSSSPKLAIGSELVNICLEVLRPSHTCSFYQKIHRVRKISVVIDLFPWVGQTETDLQYQLLRCLRNSSISTFCLRTSRLSLISGLFLIRNVSFLHFSIYSTPFLSLLSLSPLEWPPPLYPARWSRKPQTSIKR